MNCVKELIGEITRGRIFFYYVLISKKSGMFICCLLLFLEISTDIIEESFLWNLIISRKGCPCFGKWFPCGEAMGRVILSREAIERADESNRLYTGWPPNPAWRMKTTDRAIYGDWSYLNRWSLSLSRSVSIVVVKFSNMENLSHLVCQREFQYIWDSNLGPIGRSQIWSCLMIKIEYGLVTNGTD